MQSPMSVRITAFAMAVALVAGATFSLVGYSNARYAALAAAAGMQSTPTTQQAIAPARIDVVGKRAARIAA